MTARNFQTVLYNIRYLVCTHCEDIVLLGKWTTEFDWFDEFEQTKMFKYFNLAPEALEEIRWRKLGFVLDTCIGNSNMAKYDWEKRVVDIFLDKDQGDDLPDNPLPDIFRSYYTRGDDEYYEYDAACGEEQKEYDSDYEDPYADEMEDERQLARQERASSRCNRY